MYNIYTYIEKKKKKKQRLFNLFILIKYFFYYYYYLIRIRVFPSKITGEREKCFFFKSEKKL